MTAPLPARRDRDDPIIALAELLARALAARHHREAAAGGRVAAAPEGDDDALGDLRAL